MFKTFLLILIVFLIPFIIPLSAQPGIKAGMSISALQSSTEDFQPFLGYEVSWLQDGISNPKFELQLGIFYTIKFSDAFKLQPELHFSQRGYQFDQTPFYNTNYSLNINYLQLPVLLEYFLLLDWSFNPVITAGPFFALKLSSDKIIRIADKEITGGVSGVNDIDYGLVFGIGAEFPAWDGQIILDVRMNWGFANVMTQPDNFLSVSDDPGTVKTRAVILMTGYRFNLDW